MGSGSKMLTVGLLTVVNYMEKVLLRKLVDSTHPKYSQWD